MISIRCLLIALAVLPAAVHGDVPTKRNINYYQRLWTDSPFTIKPQVEAGPLINPLADYVLLGVSPIQDGYRVTLLNKKKPTDPRIIVETGKPAEGFSIVDVVRKKGMPLATEVKLSSGGATAMIGFEEKFLKLDAPQPAKTAPNQAPNANPNQGAVPKRPPLPKRPRIVRPPGLGKKK